MENECYHMANRLYLLEKHDTMITNIKNDVGKQLSHMAAQQNKTE